MLRIFLYNISKRKHDRPAMESALLHVLKVLTHSFVFQTKCLLNTIEPLTPPHRPLAPDRSMYYYS